MKLVLSIIVFAIASTTLTSCTDQTEDLKDEKIQNQKRLSANIDPDKDCPESDRNCNGVPDGKE